MRYNQHNLPLKALVAITKAQVEEQTLCVKVIKRDKYFSALIPSMRGGYKCYRVVEFTPFNERAGLGVMSNYSIGAAFGMPYIFARSRQALGVTA
jgi:hypothetical protein